MNTKRYSLKAKTLISQTATLTDHWVGVCDGQICELTDEEPANEHFDLGDVTLIPGLIDLHIHGREGRDVMDAKLSSIAHISTALAKHGVTGFLATTVTSSWRETIAAMDTLGRAAKQVMPGAQVLGGYSEGLFFNPSQKGAHNDKYFLPLSKARIDELHAAAHHQLKVIALAPELDNALEMIQYITGLGIKVNLGHTDASFDRTNEALRAGACGGVHVFNGMRGIHHREPGCTGAVLLDKNAHVEVIADGVHLHPAILTLVTKLKTNNKISLISDCISAGGMPDGRYRLGKIDVEVVQGIAKTDGGSLGGSTLALNQAIVNMCDKAQISLFDAVQMASLTPAQFLGLDDKIGSITVNKQADLAVLGNDGEVYATLFQGRLIYCNDNYDKAQALKQFIHNATKRKTQ